MALATSRRDGGVETASDPSLGLLTEARLPRATRVKNKAPAPIQITAEQILREARDRREPRIPARPCGRSPTPTSSPIIAFKSSRGSWTPSAARRGAAPPRRGPSTPNGMSGRGTSPARSPPRPATKRSG
uniref:Uncharacterized protein n=1 Tax=Arundo donax TaxID=35708 RepID=A0A0A9C0D1_ARUDO